jgi:hypothetical protein
LISRGGDALYEALRRGVGDASEGIGELQNNLRRIIKNREHDTSKLGEWIAVATPDFDHIVQSAMERVFKILDLPRRGDIEALNANLQRVAKAVESLQHTEAGKGAANRKPDRKPSSESGSKAGGKGSDKPIGKPGSKSVSKSRGEPGEKSVGRASGEPGDEVR